MTLPFGPGHGAPLSWTQPAVSSMPVFTDSTLHPKLTNLDLSSATLYPEPLLLRWPQKLIDTYFALQRHLQVSPQLAICEMVALMSVAASPLRRVRTPDGKEGPTACWLRPIAASSEGKSEALKALSKGHDLLQTEEAVRYRADLARYELMSKAHAVREKRFFARIDHLSEAEAERQAAALLATKPVRPKRYPSMLTSGTAAGVEKVLRAGYGFAAYVNPDAGTKEVDTIFEDAPRFSQLWSGDALNRQTGISGDSETISPSLTLVLMPQSSEADRQDREHGERNSGNGFRARMPSIDCEPVATKRIVRWEVVPTINEASPEIAWFNAETYKLMKGAAQASTPRVDFFSESAYSCYFQLKEITVRALSPFSGHSDIADFWGKAVEWTCRTASLIQAMDGDTGEITAKHFCAAADLTLFYLQHTKRRYGQKIEWVEPQEYKDARALEEFLARRCAALHGRGLINRNDILRYGPNQLRNRARRDAALQVLLTNGRIQFSYYGRTCFLILPAQFFPEATHYYVLPRNVGGQLHYG